MKDAGRIRYTLAIIKTVYTLGCDCSCGLGRGGGAKELCCSAYVNKVDTLKLPIQGVVLRLRLGAFLVRWTSRQWLVEGFKEYNRNPSQTKITMSEIHSSCF